MVKSLIGGLDLGCRVRGYLTAKEYAEPRHLLSWRLKGIWEFSDGFGSYYFKFHGT